MNQPTKNESVDIYVNGVRKFTYAQSCKEMLTMIRQLKLKGDVVEVRVHT